MKLFSVCADEFHDERVLQQFVEIAYYGHLSAGY